MSDALNLLIAQGFGLDNNSASAVNRNARVTNSNLATQDLNRDVTQFNLDTAQQGLADQRSVQQAIADLIQLPTQIQGASEAGTGVLGKFLDSMDRGGVNPELLPRALEMAAAPAQELQGQQQDAVTTLATLSPTGREAMIQRQFGQPEGPATNVGKLMAERDRLPEGDPRRQVYDQAIAKANTPPKGVEVKNELNLPKQPEQEKSEDQAYGKSLVDDFDTVRVAADGAEETVQALQIQRAIPVDTGSAEGIKAALGSLAIGFGAEFDEDFVSQVTNVQGFNAIAQDLLATKLATQTGPQTDDDARRMKGALASITNLPEANDFIIRASIARETRKVEMRDFAQAHKDQTGSFDGWRREWTKFKIKTPLFGKNPEDGRPIFYTEFMEDAARANPGASREELLQFWRDSFAAR